MHTSGYGPPYRKPPSTRPRCRPSKPASNGNDVIAASCWEELVQPVVAAPMPLDTGPKPRRRSHKGKGKRRSKKPPGMKLGNKKS